MPISPGDEIAGYVVEREIGRGGMGSVYVAKHPRLPRRVALKLLSLEFTDDPQYRIRFEREADLAARFDHRNIVSVLDRGTHEGRLWIAMQYIDGMDAAQALQISGGTGLGLARSVHIVSEVTAALDVAHHHRLLHRDVKPANILLAAGSYPDDPERVLLTDFGISKAADEGLNLTGTGNLLATLAYASPERILARPSDHRADIYALGCVLYELLVGSTPFPAQNPYETMQAHLDSPIPKPSANRIDIPLAVDEVVAIAMSKAPSDRYATAREMGVALRSALADAARINTADNSTPGVRIEQANDQVTGGGSGWSMPHTGRAPAPKASSASESQTEDLSLLIGFPVPDERSERPRPDTSPQVNPPNSLPTTLSPPDRLSAPLGPADRAPSTQTELIQPGRGATSAAVSGTGRKVLLAAVLALMVAAAAVVVIWRPWLGTSTAGTSLGETATLDTASSVSAQGGTAVDTTLGESATGVAGSAASSTGPSSTSSMTSTTTTTTSKKKTSSATSSTPTTPEPVYPALLLQGVYTMNWVEVSSTGVPSPTPGATFTSTRTLETTCDASGCSSWACEAAGCFNFLESSLVWRETYDYSSECVFNDSGAGTGVTVNYHREMQMGIAEVTDAQVLLLSGTAVVTQTVPCDEFDEVDVVTYEVTLIAHNP